MKFNRNFLLLLSGQSLANIGDALYIISLISILYELTHSATISTFVPLTITSAMFISSILTPLLIARFNLKTLLTCSQILKTILLIGLSIFLILELNTTNYVMVFAFAAGIALLDGCANPLRQTLIPYYVEEEQLIQANGFAETITQSIQIGTWMGGSTLLIFLSPRPLLLLVVLLSMLSSVLLHLLEKVPHQPSRQPGIWNEIIVGWQTVRKTPILRTITWMEILETIASTAWIAAILYVYVDEVLQASQYWWGLINGFFFIGLLAGSILCMKYSQLAGVYRERFIMGGIIATSVITILFALTSVPIFALVFSMLIGLFGQIKNIPQQALIQISVPTSEIATVFTTLGAVTTGAFGISSFSMGWLSDHFGVRSVFALSGALLAAASLIAFSQKRLFANNSRSEM